MIITATKSFNKDISRLRDKKIARKVEEIISHLEKAKTITEISNVKKMEGAHNAYRIRIGDYRLGLYLIAGSVHLTIFAHRKDIYKVFP